MTRYVNYPIYFGKCDICKHRTEGETCKAFPNGIPEMFIMNTYPHSVKEPDQQDDFVFEIGDLEESKKNISEEYKIALDKQLKNGFDNQFEHEYNSRKKIENMAQAKQLEKIEISS